MGNATMTTHYPLSEIPPDIVCADDYERHAREALPHSTYEHIASGSGDEITLRGNRDAFQQVQILPRMLRRFDRASAQLSLFGDRYASPMVVAPLAYQQLAHPEGELATAAAADALDCGFVCSTLASCSLERVASVGRSPKWFQLYFQASRATTLALVRRAEQAGYRAIVVTVDSSVTGIRNRSQRAGFALPDSVQAANLRELAPPPPRPLNSNESIILNGIMADAPNWDELAWLRSQTTLPLIVKGIIHPEDAHQALLLGADGLVVSNHGGRSLDGCPASLRMLPLIRRTVDAFAASHPHRTAATVLLDSGIRRGSDVFKALALGADAVLLGRPCFYALSVAGALGVAHLLRTLKEEFELTLALSGCQTPADISRDAVIIPRDFSPDIPGCETNHAADH